MFRNRDGSGSPLPFYFRSGYVDESVQTTNGNIVGIFTQLISDQGGKPVLGVIQAYDNVTRKKEFGAIPWPLFRFDPRSRTTSAGAKISTVGNSGPWRWTAVAKDLRAFWSRAWWRSGGRDDGLAVGLRLIRADAAGH